LRGIDIHLYIIDIEMNETLINHIPFFFYYDIDTKFLLPLAVTNLYREHVRHTRWVLLSQLNFLHTHEPEINPLTTCLREPIPLPLEPIHCWSYSFTLLTNINTFEIRNINTTEKLIYIYIYYSKPTIFIYPYLSGPL
jgi:hypothetical protein